MDKDIDEPGDRDELHEHAERDELDHAERDKLDELGERDGAAEPWPPAGYPRPRNATRRRRWRRVAALAATAVLAAAAGFAVVTAVLRDGTASPAANASPGATQPGGTGPGGTAPGGGAPSGGAGNLLPPGTGGGPIPTPGPGQTLRLEMSGKLTAVSATSITLAAGGQRVTAAVTGATKVTGKVSDISGVKVGDMVTAQITGSGGRLTVTAIQDPASVP
jgi:hypothetical protein